MKPPSPRRLMQAVSAAQQAIAAAGDKIDPQLRMDTVEGESDALEIMDRFAELVIADEALADMARQRAQRLEKRAEVHRKIVEHMLVALELGEPVERAAYTASLSYRSSAVIIDSTLLPDELIRKAPDMRLITKVLHDGVAVDGATLGNPEPHLMLRTK